MGSAASTNRKGRRPEGDGEHAKRKELRGEGKKVLSSKKKNWSGKKGEGWREERDNKRHERMCTGEKNQTAWNKRKR